MAPSAGPDPAAVPPPVVVPPPAAADTIAAVAAAAATIASVSAAEDAHCHSVAQQRKQDAGANGYDDATQQQLYDGTYQNCITWVQQHPAP